MQDTNSFSNDDFACEKHIKEAKAAVDSQEEDPSPLIFGHQIPGEEEGPSSRRLRLKTAGDSEED